MSDSPDDFASEKLPEQAREAHGEQIALRAGPVLVLGFLAGIHIAFGSVFFLVAQTVPESLPFGVTQILSGLAFSVGLILVIVAGGELFTGNTLMLSRLYSGESPMAAIARVWGLCYAGNLAGSLFVVMLFLWAGGHQVDDGWLGAVAVEIAGDKTAKGAGATFASGILANLLVCLAVWMSFAARTVPGKVMVIIPPIACFVAAGFEHSVANMSLVPMGLGVLWLDGGAADPSLTVAGFVHNLVWSTLGNIVGGAIVAVAYSYSYGDADENDAEEG